MEPTTMKNYTSIFFPARLISKKDWRAIGTICAHNRIDTGVLFAQAMKRFLKETKKGKKIPVIIYENPKET